MSVSARPSIDSSVRRVSPVAPAAVGPTIVSRLQQSRLFREYQEAFEATTGLPLVLREPGSFRPPLEGSRRANPFCTLMTQASASCAACLRLQERVEQAATHQPITLQCHAGLSETAVPVRVGGILLGYLQTGQVFLSAPSRRHHRIFTRAAPGAGADARADALEAAYFQTRVVDKAQYESIIRLLAIFAEHLATVSNQLLITEAAAESPFMSKVRTYIVEHQSEELTLREVARAVNVSAFYFCKVFKHATGVTFVAYLSRARIESVKRSLLNVHARVSEAAYSAGFQSLSQFNRTFRRVAGESPSSYRDRLHGTNGNTPRNGVLVRAA